MKFKLKALAAAVALVVAGGANAAITLPSGTSGGSLLFEAWDANQAFIIDLGKTFDSTYGSPAAVTTQTGGDQAFALGTAFTTAFGTNAAVQWHVVSAKSLASAAGPNGFLATASTGTFGSFNNNAINNLTGGTPTQYGNIATALPTGSGIVTNTSPAYTPNNWGANFQYGPLNTALGNTGNAITGYFTGAIDAATSYAAGTGVGLFASVINSNGGSGGLGQTTKTLFAGSQGNADFILQSNGTLTYHVASAPAAVPLPAAFWLFGSGLLGLVGVGRRNRKEA